MTVAASIILAAVVGGVIFVLLDSWQRRSTPSPAAVVEPEPSPWRPEPRTQPLPSPPVWASWDADDRWPSRREDDGPPGNLWSGWARREQQRRYYDE